MKVSVRTSMALFICFLFAYVCNKSHAAKTSRLPLKLHILGLNQASSTVLKLRKILQRRQYLLEFSSSVSTFESKLVLVYFGGKRYAFRFQRQEYKFHVSFSTKRPNLLAENLVAEMALFFDGIQGVRLARRKMKHNKRSSQPNNLGIQKQKASPKQAIKHATNKTDRKQKKELGTSKKPSARNSRSSKKRMHLKKKLSGIGETTSQQGGGSSKNQKSSKKAQTRKQPVITTKKTTSRRTNKVELPTRTKSAATTSRVLPGKKTENAKSTKNTTKTKKILVTKSVGKSPKPRVKKVSITPNTVAKRKRKKKSAPAIRITPKNKHGYFAIGLGSHNSLLVDKRQYVQIGLSLFGEFAWKRLTFRAEMNFHSVVNRALDNPKNVREVYLFQPNFQVGGRFHIPQKNNRVKLHIMGLFGIGTEHILEELSFEKAESYLNVGFYLSTKLDVYFTKDWGFYTLLSGFWLPQALIQYESPNGFERDLIRVSVAVGFQFGRFFHFF